MRFLFLCCNFPSGRGCHWILFPQVGVVPLVVVGLASVSSWGGPSGATSAVHAASAGQGRAATQQLSGVWG